MTNDNISFMNSPSICDLCNFVSDGVGDPKRNKDADPAKTLPSHTSDAHMELRGLSREGNIQRIFGMGLVEF